MAEQFPTKILRVRDAPRLSLLGGVDRFKAVDFTLDGQNIHTVTMPEADFTAEKARAKIEEQAKVIRALLSS